MLDKTSSIICAFGLASTAPRSPYRHLELCGIALNQSRKGSADETSEAMVSAGQGECSTWETSSRMKKVGREFLKAFVSNNITIGRERP